MFKSNFEYLLTKCDNPLNENISQLSSIEFLITILSNLSEDPNRWKPSYNEKC